MRLRGNAASRQCGFSVINVNLPGRYFHTLRYLRPVQVTGRLRRRLIRPRPDTRPAPPPRRPPENDLCWAERPAALMTGPATFHFLGVCRTLTQPADWDCADWERLWRYNLHYFDDLIAPDAAARGDWHHALILRWIRENPVADGGTGWEPYPLSLRIVNWIKWALAGNDLTDSMRVSLTAQVRWLRQSLEWHLLGNHLWANAKALLFAGVFFYGPEADEWRRTGLRILERERAEQILPDGGHFERSPMYHSIVLEDLLDLHALTHAYEMPLPRADVWQDTVQRMRRWLKTMCHPDGQIAFFNDAAFGIAPTPAALECFAQHLGFRPVPAPEDGLTPLAASGYVRAQISPAVALLDIAPIGPDYLPGHAHADTLSFEMSLHGRRFVVNSGTSTYAAGPQRQWERSTAAHSTVAIGGQDSSEVWGGFRVARRARPIVQHWSVDEHRGALVVQGAHNGYQRLPGRPIHRRTWRLTPENLEITDEVSAGWQSAVACFPLHPQVVRAPDSTDSRPEKSVTLQIGPHPVHWHVAPCGLLSLAETSYHPRFGASVPNLTLCVPFTGLALRTFISWR